MIYELTHHLSLIIYHSIDCNHWITAIFIAIAIDNLKEFQCVKRKIAYLELVEGSFANSYKLQILNLLRDH
ncbi:MAG: hypothetical protein ACJATI_000646 [Halioglobus sp.]|jgi:hypothetical protein